MLYYQAVILFLLVLIAGLVRRNHRDYARAGAAAEPAPCGPGSAPLVSVLVPARNEAAHIAACLAGLLRQEYPHWEIDVLDDGSTDDTAARVEQLAAGTPELRLLRGAALPAGWAGKAHACWELARHARGEWLLFLDADTRHAPGLLSRAMREAQATRADLLSTFPRQQIGSAGEALMVPYLSWILFTLLPIRQVWEHDSPAFTAACGQLLLVRREAYFRSGGHAAIRASLHDGLHLARLFKRRGLRVRLVDLSDQVSCRMYRGGRECWNGFSRNAYQAIGSLPALALLTLLQIVLFLNPFLFLIGTAGVHRPGGSVLVVLQSTLLIGIQVSLKRRFGYPWLAVLLLPASIATWLAIQWRGWWLTTTGTQVMWKDRTVPPRCPPNNRLTPPPRLL